MGTVGDDLWAAGATVDVGAPVGDNAMLAGRDVNLEASAKVASDVRIAGTNVTVQAPIEGMCESAHKTPAVGSEIGGSVQVPPAQALDDQTPLPLPTVGEVDVDSNGFISTGESVAVPGLLEEMNRLDEDRDGKINISEYAAFQPPLANASGEIL